MNVELEYAAACQRLAAKHYALARQWRNFCADWCFSTEDRYHRAYVSAAETAALYAKTARLYMGVE